MNKNKLAVEEQERHISRAQSKSSEDQDLNKKTKEGSCSIENHESKFGEKGEPHRDSDIQPFEFYQLSETI